MLSKQEFLNAQDTSLSSLRGSRYNLELQNISKRITANTAAKRKGFKGFTVIQDFNFIYFINVWCNLFLPTT